MVDKMFQISMQLMRKCLLIFNFSTVAVTKQLQQSRYNYDISQTVTSRNEQTDTV